MPTGYSFNLDGTCIYLTLGALFIVQASGQNMALGEQLALAGLMILTSKGAAGITGAGLVTLTASLQAFGGDVLLGGVDRHRHRARRRHRPRHVRGPRAGLVVAQETPAAPAPATVQRAGERREEIPAQDGRMQERRPEDGEEEPQRGQARPG